MTLFDATAQAELVRRGEASPKELVSDAIAAIEKLNPELNAVIHERFDKALAEADHVDPSGPFAGVPYLAKDGGCATEGDPYHRGLGVLKEAGFRSPVDSELALRFRKAGFICVGRTNVPQLLLSSTTEPDAYGPTRNPWSTDRSAGGSSGGSGAAVAAGMVAVAHGNDAGGSIRIPASHCGVVGLKPTRARTSDGPLVGQTWGGLNHEFALTRSIRDTAALLDALAGRAWGDPAAAPPPARPWIDELRAAPGRARVYVVTATSRGATDPQIAAAVEDVARLLAELGHDVTSGQLPELDEDVPWGVVTAVNAARDVERLSALAGVSIEPDDLEPLPAMSVTGGRAITATQYVGALDAMHAYSRRLEARWADFDVLLTPTCAVAPSRIGELGPHVDLATLGTGLGARTWFTAPFDITGQPSISLPLAHAADGMPIGIQLTAATGGEDVLIRLSAQLEEARPWGSRAPAVSR